MELAGCRCFWGFSRVEEGCAAVSKTVEHASVPRVRIPYSPPLQPKGRLGCSRSGGQASGLSAGANRTVLPGASGVGRCTANSNQTWGHDASAGGLLVALGPVSTLCPSSHPPSVPTTVAPAVGETLIVDTSCKRPPTPFCPESRSLSQTAVFETAGFGPVSVMRRYELDQRRHTSPDIEWPLAWSESQLSSGSEPGSNRQELPTLANTHRM